MLRGTRGETAGAKLGTDPVDRCAVNVGSVPGLSRRSAIQAGAGQVRARPMGPGRGGAAAVSRYRYRAANIATPWASTPSRLIA